MFSRSLRERTVVFVLIPVLFLMPFVAMQNLQTVSIDVHRKVCSASNANMMPLNHVERDYWPTEEWKFSTPSQQVMNGSRLEDMLAHIAVEDYNIDCIIIVRNGYIVLEEYLNPGYTNTTLHPIFSCTKSILSALFGVALEKDIISGLNQKVLSFFPNRVFANLDSRKQNITLEHLLTMTSGLEWFEFLVPYEDPNSSFRHMDTSPDWIQYVLDRPMVEELGTKWNYNSGCSHVLSVILQDLIGTSFDDYLSWISTHFLEPIGLGESEWRVNPQGYFVGASGIHITPRDMAKFGYLYLNNGTWDGNQVIPESWVELSIQKHINALLTGWVSSIHYGYQWWLYPEIGTYAATGVLGQNIMIMPEHDMVVVFASSLDPDQWPFLDLVSDFIIPAAVEGAVPDQIPMELIVAAIAVPIVLVIVVISYFKKQQSS